MKDRKLDAVPSLPPRQVVYKHFGFEGELVVKYAPLYLRRRLSATDNDDEFSLLVIQKEDAHFRSIESIVELQSSDNQSVSMPTAQDPSSDRTQLIGMSMAIVLIALGLVLFLFHMWKTFKAIQNQAAIETVKDTDGSASAEGFSSQEDSSPPVCHVMGTPDTTNDDEDIVSLDALSIGHVSTMTASVLDAEGQVALGLDEVGEDPEDGGMDPQSLPVVENLLIAQGEFDPSALSSLVGMNDGNQQEYSRPLYCVVTSGAANLGIHVDDATSPATHPTVVEIDSDTSISKRLFAHDIILALNDSDTAGWSKQDVAEAIDAACSKSTVEKPAILKFMVMSIHQKTFSEEDGKFLEI